MNHHKFMELLKVRKDNEFNDLWSLPMTIGWAVKEFCKDLHHH